MKILVPLKQVADPDNANKIKVPPDGSKIATDGLEPKPNPFDEYAVETALRLNENGKTKDRLGETVVVSIGPKDTMSTIRKMLGTGADRGIIVTADDAQLDSLVVARTLKAIVDKEKPDIVLMGKQAVDGESNAAGQMLAELLGWPMATFAMSIETADGGKSFLVGREVDTGTLTVKVTAPAVITVDLRIVSSHAVRNGVTPGDFAYGDGEGGVRFSPLKSIMAAGKKPVEEIPIASLGFDVAPATKYLKFEPPTARKGGVAYVETVHDLVQKLHNEAKVI